MPLGLFVQPRRLDGHRQLARRGPQSLDLAPIGTPLVGAVVADLEHTGGPA